MNAYETIKNKNLHQKSVLDTFVTACKPHIRPKVNNNNPATLGLKINHFTDPTKPEDLVAPPLVAADDVC